MTKTAFALAGAAVLICPDRAAAQEFTLPISSSHVIYEPSAEIVEPQTARWTYGVGMASALADRPGRGLVAQATYGGTYYYLAAGVGLWNDGTVGTRNQLGVGVNYHYNVYQSPDARARIGHQLGWSAAIGGHERTHVLIYRPRLSYALGRSWTLYGGAGGETVWRLTGGDSSRRSTTASLLAGVYTRLGANVGWSTGIERVFSGPARVRFSTSIHLVPKRNRPRSGPAR